MGMDLRVVSAESLFPEGELLNEAEALATESRGKVTLTSDVSEGVKGVDVIYTDVWVSMGEESKIKERIQLLMPYQVNSDMIERTGNPEVIFLHCLPCFHNTDTEVSRQFPDICFLRFGNNLLTPTWHVKQHTSLPLPIPFSTLVFLGVCEQFFAEGFLPYFLFFHNLYS